MKEEPLAQELRAAVHAVSLVWAILAGAMLLCAVADLYAGDGDWRVFAVSAAVVLTAAGMTALATRGPSPRPSQRFGFLLVAMIWALTPVAGATPLYLYGLSLSDAMFEAVSGFTTTGATVIAGLDDLPPGILLWRSISQWLGGIGILALGLVLLPFLRIGGMQLFSKESSDRFGRPLPRFAAFSKALLGVYAALTVLCVVSYGAVGLSGFDALNHALTTVSTAGFSTYDASFGHFESVGPLWVGSLFMVLGALPFSVYVALVFARRAPVFDPQIPVFLTLATVAAAIALTELPQEVGEALALAVFNVVSVITTTGYAASDYPSAGTLSFALFYGLMFLGGCAGSTTGGLKTYRLIVTFALLRDHLHRLIYPDAVSVQRYGDRQVDPAVYRSAMVFLVAFAITLMALTLALAACGLDFVTAHSGALAALTNVGPGLGPIIGPSGNFSSLPDTAKWLLCFGMIFGRLEILTLLVLLTPDFWRR